MAHRSSGRGDRMLVKRVLGVALTAVLAMALGGCSGVVARVNGEDITKKEFTELLQREAGVQVLQTAIMRRLVLERAKAENVLPKPEEVRAEFDKYKKEK